MFSVFNSFSSIPFMGLPDSSSSSNVFTPHKDTQNLDCNNFFFRPSLQFQEPCQVSPSQDQERSSEDQQVKVLLEVSSSLKVKLPLREAEEEEKEVLIMSSSSVREICGAGKVRDEEEEKEDGSKTPTSKNNKIPQMICPPPPRKPKPIPSVNKKGSNRRRVFLDLSDEIESLFPPALLADFGNKIKKVRKESFIIC